MDEAEENGKERSSKDDTSKVSLTSQSTYLWNGPSANQFIVSKAPPTIRYIQNFITPEEEQLFLSEIYSAPKPKWQQLLNRRLQNWGGIVGRKSLIPDDNIPEWLNFLINKLMSLPDAFPSEHRPNHVLINEYQPGQGIMKCAKKESRYAGSMLLERRSLLLVSDEAYTYYLHEIDERSSDEVTEDVFNQNVSNVEIGQRIDRQLR
ncbi:unnamed protein product [Anisakis simplex]|uniref:2OG-FeII_Oxy_2 domain-containing protein n=1 Tax=Anisakis simplex TaxID=6269 RepID=A0A0M3K0I0_ANISI|nr:unnamed protein product [Anisakis simplex]